VTRLPGPPKSRSGVDGGLFEHLKRRPGRDLESKRGAPPTSPVYPGASLVPGHDLRGRQTTPTLRASATAGRPRADHLASCNAIQHWLTFQGYPLRESRRPARATYQPRSRGHFPEVGCMNGAAAYCFEQNGLLLPGTFRAWGSRRQRSAQRPCACRRPPGLHCRRARTCSFVSRSTAKSWLTDVGVGPGFP